MRVTYIVTDLITGGAEIALLNLTTNLVKHGIHAEVISLTDQLQIANKFEEAGIRVRSLGLSRQKPNPFLLFRLSSWIRDSKPDIVQTWMYHADLLGSIATRLADDFPIVWSIHNSTLDRKSSRLTTRIIVRLLAVLSKRIPGAIVSVSEEARRVHIEKGYSADKFRIIPNGFDLNVYKPDNLARIEVRKELDIDLSSRLVGHIARYDPQKDHANFLKAAKIVNKNFPTAHFLLAGEGVDGANMELVKTVRLCGLRENIHLLGRRNDIPRIMSSLDIFVTSSAYGEAFPLVVGEAMACGIPCVVTDVGDSAIIVKDIGIIAPPRNPLVLANGICKLLSLSKSEMREIGGKARLRIENKFSMEHITQMYVDLYQDIRGSKSL